MTCSCNRQLLGGRISVGCRFYTDWRQQSLDGWSMDCVATCNLGEVQHPDQLLEPDSGRATNRDRTHTKLTVTKQASAKNRI